MIYISFYSSLCWILFYLVYFSSSRLCPKFINTFFCVLSCLIFILFFSLSLSFYSFPILFFMSYVSFYYYSFILQTFFPLHTLFFNLYFSVSLFRSFIFSAQLPSLISIVFFFFSFSLISLFLLFVSSFRFPSFFLLNFLSTSLFFLNVHSTSLNFFSSQFSLYVSL